MEHVSLFSLSQSRGDSGSFTVPGRQALPTPQIDKSWEHEVGLEALRGGIWETPEEAELTDSVGVQLSPRCHGYTGITWSTYRKYYTPTDTYV